MTTTDEKQSAAADKTDNANESPLLQRLREDLKAAMRSKDAGRRDTVRQIMAEFPRLTIPITLESGKKTTRLKKSQEITDDDIIGIIRGLAKSEQTVLEMTGAKTSAYLETLQRYLPQMADEQTIVAWIRENVDFSRYNNKMQAMGTIMKHFGKSADGKMVNSILRGWE